MTCDKKVPAASTAGTRGEHRGALQLTSLADEDDTLKTPPPCGEPYQGVDMRLHVCGRPAGHESHHFTRPFPFDPRPIAEPVAHAECVECHLFDRVSELVPCDECSAPIHEHCGHECNRCSGVFCTRCMVDSPDPDACPRCIARTVGARV